VARYLAIDYGTKRTGIAVTDPLKIFANGLCTVHTSELITFLTDYLQKEEVELFVVGYPLGLDDRVTKHQKRVDEFITHLSRKFPDIKIEREDERFTSKMAKQTLIDSGIKKKKRREKGLVDEVSATIILQSYLGNI